MTEKTMTIQNGMVAVHNENQLPGSRSPAPKNGKSRDDAELCVASLHRHTGSV